MVADAFNRPLHVAAFAVIPTLICVKCKRRLIDNFSDRLRIHHANMLITGKEENPPARQLLESRSRDSNEVA